ncbi:MAG: hypothetical protein QOE41_522 [Mycobacterium sp.]|jgi:hypothetical protein|nr:hypothetical protein [Mycobacterium sp.]MDT5131211.1 hypothetical protein [Mycobacterium sp.]
MLVISCEQGPEGVVSQADCAGLADDVAAEFGVVVEVGLRVVLVVWKVMDPQTVSARVSRKPRSTARWSSRIAGGSCSAETATD